MCLNNLANAFSDSSAHPIKFGGCLGLTVLRAALRAKVRQLPPPPELTTEQLEGQKEVRKKLPELLNDHLKTVSVLLAKEAGCIPSHILQVRLKSNIFCQR